MIETNRNPSPRTLRQFSLAAGVFAAILGYVVFARTGSPMAPGVIWAAGVLTVAAGLARPGLVRPVYFALSFITMPIGAVVSIIVLGIVYYGVVTPIGVAMRLMGRDPMNRRPDPSADTYWIQRKETPDDRCFRQF